MYSYAKPSLKHEPNAIIIHCGTNNLKEEKTAEEIASDITRLACSLRNETTEVIVSGITPRKDKLDAKGKLVNIILYRKLSERNLGYVDNNNINVTNDLNKSGLHLNYSGIKILADNFIDNNNNNNNNNTYL